MAPVAVVAGVSGRGELRTAPLPSEGSTWRCWPGVKLASLPPRATLRARVAGSCGLDGRVLF